MAIVFNHYKISLSPPLRSDFFFVYFAILIVNVYTFLWRLRLLLRQTAKPPRWLQPPPAQLLTPLSSPQTLSQVRIFILRLHWCVCRTECLLSTLQTFGQGWLFLVFIPSRLPLIWQIFRHVVLKLYFFLFINIIYNIPV